MPDMGLLQPLWNSVNLNYLITQLMKKFLVIGLLLCITNTPTFSQDLVFNTAQILNTDQGPNSFTLGDFNKDDITDIVVANGFSQNISLFIGRPDGLFRDTLNFALDFAPQEITSGDVNKDGLRDLVFINDQEQVVLLLGIQSNNRNSAAFANPKILLSTFAPRDLVLEDLDNDQNLDVAVAGDFLHILFGDGAGNFRSRGANVLIDEASDLLITGDFNNDDLLDLAAVNIGFQRLVILTNEPDSDAFTLHAISLDFFPFDVIAGRFDEDVHTDLAFTSKFDNNIHLLFGEGDGTFEDTKQIPVGVPSAGITTGDFNKDDLIDFAFTSELEDKTVLLLGAGNRNFNLSRELSTGVSPEDIISNDFNQDGILDLLVLNIGSGTLSLFQGQANAQFPNTFNRETGPFPFSIKTGDFNNDNFLDIVVANSHLGSEDASISLFLNDRQGGFLEGTSINLRKANCFTTQDLVIADFNSDGNFDIAAVNAGGDGCIVILAGNGDGTFRNPDFITVNGSPSSIIADDFNNDNFVDLAFVDSRNTSNQSNPNGRIGVLLGLNDLTFRSPQFFEVGISPRDLTSADLDGDNETDLIVTNASESTISILFGLGDSQFIFGDNVLTLTTADGVPIIPFGIESGDFDEDGRTDLVVTGAVQNNVTILLARGQASQSDLRFRSIGPFEVGKVPLELTVNDFNRDGHLDIATANEVSSSASVWLGNGQGSLEIRTDWGTGISPSGITSADLNRDGTPDLLTANELSNNISILYNFSPLSLDFASVVDVLLINADDDSIVGPFLNGSLIDISQTGYQVSFLALLDSNRVGSVRFELEETSGQGFRKVSQENFAPFTLAGNVENSFEGIDIPVGTYNLKVIPYPLKNGRGLPGRALQLTFDVIDGGNVPGSSGEDSTDASSALELTDFSFNAYPNIAQDIVHFDLSLPEVGTGIFQILNSQGALIYENEFNQAFKTELDLSKWGKGLYFARIVSADGQIGETLRVIVQ